MSGTDDSRNGVVLSKTGLCGSFSSAVFTFTTAVTTSSASSAGKLVSISSELSDCRVLLGSISISSGIVDGSSSNPGTIRLPLPIGWPVFLVESADLAPGTEVPAGVGILETDCVCMGGTKATAVLVGNMLVWECVVGVSDVDTVVVVKGALNSLTGMSVIKEQIKMSAWKARAEKTMVIHNV